MLKSKKAFTLIELLVVIAIIGILATVSVIALSNARAKSRDAKRIGDVKQVQTALELYFNDMNRYPLSAEFASAISSTSTQGTTTYMARIPVAATPADGNCSDSDNSFYYSSTDGSTYTLSFCIGGDTGSLTAGLNTLSPGGIAYGGPGSGDTGGASCSCDNASLPCCNLCHPTLAVCQGGEYCARDANCPVGQGCNGGTCTGFTCGSPITINTIGSYTCDEGSSHGDECHYDTVLIGSQCWMKQNMNVGSMIGVASNQANNSSLEKYCYDGSAANCTSQGGLYQWGEAVQYLNGASNTTDWNPAPAGNVQGICPTGWHIPTHDEWTTLERAVCTSGTCATDFPYNNTTVGWVGTNEASKLSAHTLNGTNSSGFSALMAGYREYRWVLYGHQTTYAHFWSSSINGADAWSRALYFGNGTVLRTQDNYLRAYGYSIRCLKD